MQKRRSGRRNQKNNPITILSIIIVILCLLADRFGVFNKINEMISKVDREVTDIASGSDTNSDEVASDDTSATISADPNADSYTISTSDSASYTISAYYGDPSVLVNNNTPTFTQDELTAGEDTLYLSDLDEHGRVGQAYAVFSESDMPDYDRTGSLSGFTPAGWVQAYYEDLEIEHLYDRSHLLGYQFWGNESNDIRNLTTGTIYFNETTMVGYENDLAQYLRNNPSDSVLYRVTPYFIGDELVPRGVLMEAKSLHSDNYSMCVFCYNVQPGITIDYATGESSIAQ